MSEEYPNDKETQDWMNAPLGKPISTPEEQVKFWSDKYEAKCEELHEMFKEARSFEGCFNVATETIKQLEQEVSFLKESRSKWAKQSSENADNLEKALASWHMKCIRLEDRIDLMCDEFKRIKSLTDNLEIHGLCDRAMQDIKQNISVIAQRDNAEAREIVLRRNLENAYAEAKRIYPEFDWEGFTQTSEIIVMALYDKIKMQGEKLNEAEAQVAKYRKALQPFVDNYDRYGNHASFSHGLFIKAKQALEDTPKETGKHGTGKSQGL